VRSPEVERRKINNEPQGVAEGVGRLQLELLLWVLAAAVRLEELQKQRVAYDHLELLLWGAVTMPHHGDDGE
jgi:hypothetical protein